MRQRAQAIIIRDGAMLFAYGFASSHHEIRHSFIGGGIEAGETPEVAVLRELKEEALVDGTIIFQFSEEVAKNHHTFLIDIGTQACKLGVDPEEEHLCHEDRSLKELVWIKLGDMHLFTDCDKEYIAQLIRECSLKNYQPAWVDQLMPVVRAKQDTGALQ